MENKLMDVFLRTIDKCEIDSQHRFLIEEALDFLNTEQRFAQLYNTATDLAELKELGIKLNKMRTGICKTIDKLNFSNGLTFGRTKGLRDKFYLLGIFCIIRCDVFDNNVNQYLLKLKYNLPCPDSKTILFDFFETLYDTCSVLETVYDMSGIEGVTRYILINNKIYKECSLSVLELINRQELSKEMLFKLTLSHSDLSGYNSNIQAKKILNKEFSNINQNQKVIYL